MPNQAEVEVVFACVRNAGRSQMAAAFAERELDRRGLGGRVEVRSGGTRPADEIHGGVREVMSEVGVDLSEASPGYVDLELLRDSEYLVTMGCTIAEFNPNSLGVDTREWDLTDPAEADPETARAVRDELEERVEGLVDEIEADLAEPVESRSLSARIRDSLGLG
jgi:protein-tyrosine-phosphatase